MEISNINPAWEMYIRITHSRSGKQLTFHNTQSWVAQGYDYEDLAPNRNNYRIAGIPEGFDDLAQNNITTQSGAIANVATNTYTTYLPREMAIAFHVYTQNNDFSERAMDYATQALSTYEDDLLSIEVYFPTEGYGYLTYGLVAEGQSLTSGKLVLNDMNDNLFYRYHLTETGEIEFEFQDERDVTITESGDYISYRNIIRPEPIFIKVDATPQQVIMRNARNLGYLHKSTTENSNFMSDSFVNYAGSTTANWLINYPDKVKGAPIWLTPGDNYIRFSLFDGGNPNIRVTSKRYVTLNCVPMYRITGQESW